MPVARSHRAHELWPFQANLTYFISRNTRRAQLTVKHSLFAFERDRVSSSAADDEYGIGNGSRNGRFAESAHSKLLCDKQIIR